jgi:four helix bundle protein
MLRIYDVMLHAIGVMRPMLAAIERRDGDLANQLRRAASSVVLNIAEGSGSFSGTRRMRYRTALGSARETLACLRTAQAFGYVGRMEPALLGEMNQVIGTLVRVAA